jgi:hypothetical protein
VGCEGGGPDRDAVRRRASPRLEVGQRYVAPILLEDDRSPSEWWPLTLSSQLALSGDRVLAPSPRADSETARELAGSTIAEVRSAINARDAGAR